MHNKIYKNMIMLLILICIALTIFFCYKKAYGAAHLAVNMNPVEEEVLIITDLFPNTITTKFEIEENGELVYIAHEGTFVGVKLIKQEGIERTELTNLIVTDTVIDLKEYSLVENTAYQLCIKPYYDFGDFGIINSSVMSEYNFSNYTIKNSTINPPKSITFMFKN